MKQDFEKYGSRLVEITREFLRAKNVEAWMDAYCAVCAEAVPGRVDNAVVIAQQMSAITMGRLSSTERVQFASALMSVPDLIGQLQAKIYAIKVQRGALS